MDDATVFQIDPPPLDGCKAMNLETLKASARTVKPVKWLGQSIYLRRLSAADGFLIFGRVSEASAKTLTPSEDSQETCEFYALLLSKSICDEQGTLSLDSDDGRIAIKDVEYSAMIELGQVALEFNGVNAAGDTKKNLMTSSVSPTASADTLDASTPTSSA